MTSPCKKAMQSKIKVGDRAPDFKLPDASGRTVSLSDFRGKNVVLFFYPKDFTPGCTKEACSFRDHYEVFKEAGAEVIGISSDSPASHKRFAASFNLPFVLLSDRNDQVRKAFGVPSTLGIIPGRVTYVLDKEGVVRHIFSSQFQAAKHVREALKIIKELYST